ncbi:SBBP repeat-containing protein [bacterium]|nr:SBBP repeat-containing protein [bacterium]
MKKGFVPLCFVFIGLFLSCSITGGEVLHTKGSGLNAKSQNGHSVNMDTEKPRIDFAEIPLYFIANKGQVNDKARFYAKAAGYTLWLTKEGLVFDSARRTGDRGSAIARKEAGEVKRDVSRFYFVNANTKPEILPVQETKLRVNYFIGADRSKWHGDIPTSQAVLYKNLYKGIDLKVYGIEKQIEYDWIVRPGENPKAIRFEYKGIKGTRIDDKGNLLVETDSGELIHKRPVTYQEIGDRRVKVRAEYRKTGENSYGFEVGEYDKSYALIIDPVVLAYSTYLGGAGDDRGYGIAVDSSGNAYVAGPTESTDFPILNQYQATNQGNLDSFIIKIDTTQSGASSLVYSTYLGGSGEDCAFGIAADSSGNAYVTGDTDSTDFPILNQYQTNQDGDDAFVTKIDTTQSGIASLIYSTYLGGAGADGGSGIALDSSGNAYVTGETNSTDFPTRNQYQATNHGLWDAFVTKIDTTQSGIASLIYSTYLGGADSDRGYGIAADSGGNAYVTGSTESTDFPILNQYQATNQGDLDVFVTRIDTTQSGASSLIYSTYLGGAGDDYGQQIVADSYGNVYVTGSTESTDFPILNQYQATNQGLSDVFVTRIDTTQSGASSLIYSTYLGGASYDMGSGIALDSSGNAYVTGKTKSTDFPILNEYQTYQGGSNCYDVFVTKIDTTQSGIASLIYSTYLGGADADYSGGIAVDSSGNAYVTGDTDSTDFPILNQYQTDQGSGDVFVTKLAAFPPAVPNGGCFIATAAFGSPVEPQVKVLREFRDRFLLTNTVGKAFVRLYYAWSPSIADFIASNDELRAVVRLSLLPLVGMSWAALHPGPTFTLMLIVLLIGVISFSGLGLIRKIGPRWYKK